MNFWKRYPADYQRKTARLTLAQHGAYTLLLDELYTAESPLPADITELFRICRAMSKSEQGAVRLVADRFFPVNEDGLRHNKRATEELVEAAPAVAAARANGAKGGRPKKPTGLSGKNPTGNPTGSQTETQKEPSSKAPHSSELREEKEIPPSGVEGAKPSKWERPEWMPAKEWGEFEAMRKAMRGVPFSDAARAGVVREIVKLKALGHDPASLLSAAVTSGWRTVYAPKGPVLVQTDRFAGAI